MGTTRAGCVEQASHLQVGKAGSGLYNNFSEDPILGVTALIPGLPSRPSFKGAPHPPGTTLQSSSLYSQWILLGMPTTTKSQQSASEISAATKDHTPSFSSWGPAEGAVRMIAFLMDRECAERSVPNAYVLLSAGHRK